MHSLSLLALAGSAAAQIRGFNYGALYADNRARLQPDWEADFRAAQNLPGTSGFTSARLFTMIQGYTDNNISSAIPAAIATNTSLLLGLWGSAGQAAFNQELTALRNAISQYGPQLQDLIVGISVGSEDLYRTSPTGIENESGPGAQPQELVSYIQQTRDVIRGTVWADKGLGHVDTFNDWTNSSNNAVISAVDWIGMDAYPYYQTVNANGIENGESLFFEAYNETVAVAQGKPVWITETGWPVTGAQSGAATAGVANAETYWKDVACRVLGNINVWWYQLNDGADQATSFKVIPADRGAPLYDLSCPNSAAPSSPAISTQATSAASSAAGSVTTQVVPQPTTVEPLPTTQVAQPPKPSTLVTSVASSAVASSSSAPASAPSSGKSCPAELHGPYEYPHLLVPVNKDEPHKAYGTQYNATLTPSISSIFNFDIRPDYAGKTCSLVFLFPEQKDLVTSSFNFNGKGGLSVAELKEPATEATTYENKPGASGASGAIHEVKPGNSYTVFSETCKAGQRVGYEFTSSGDLNLDYFQDYNPSPIGAYITVC